MLITLFTLTTSAAVAAKDYEVELMVFQHMGPDTSENEIWRNSVPPQKLIQRMLEAEELANSEKITNLTDKQLAHLASRLQASSAYALITHLAWLQSLLPKRQAPLVALRRGVLSNVAPSSNSALVGTVRVYGGHFILVELELLLRPSGGTQTPIQNTSDSRFGYYERQFDVRYTLSEKRRLKLNEIHYFDHPMFGAILQVRPVVEPD